VCAAAEDLFQLLPILPPDVKGFFPPTTRRTFSPAPFEADLARVGFFLRAILVATGTYPILFGAPIVVLRFVAGEGAELCGWASILECGCQERAASTADSSLAQFTRSR
jgi:hypothetical protein